MRLSKLLREPQIARRPFPLSLERAEYKGPGKVFGPKEFSPSPFHQGWVTITTKIANEPIKVFNSKGQKIATLKHGNSRVWQGIDPKTGGRVPPGTYVFQTRSMSGSSLFQKLVGF